MSYGNDRQALRPPARAAINGARTTKAVSLSVSTAFAVGHLGFSSPAHFHMGVANVAEFGTLSQSPMAG